LPLGRLFHEMADDAQVGGLVARGMLELDGSRA